MAENEIYTLYIPISSQILIQIYFTDTFISLYYKKQLLQIFEPYSPYANIFAQYICKINVFVKEFLRYFVKYFVGQKQSEPYSPLLPPEPAWPTSSHKACHQHEFKFKFNIRFQHLKIYKSKIRHVKKYKWPTSSHKACRQNDFLNLLI